MFTGLKKRLLETAKNILLGNDAARFWTYREKYFRTKTACFGCITSTAAPSSCAGTMRLFHGYRN